MSKQRARHSRFSVLMVQSIVCGVLVLLALIFRLLGEGWYAEWRAVLRDSMTDLSFVQTLVDFSGNGETNRA